MRRGQPVVVHGDGTSLWTLTHHDDFAKGFVGLLGHPRAIGDGFHITSDDVLTWNQISDLARPPRPERQPRTRARAVGRDRRRRPGLGRRAAGRQGALDDLRQQQDQGAGARTTWPPSRSQQGAREIVAWHDADPARQVVDAALNSTIDSLVARIAG